jgi:hypothetical protein
MQTKIRGAFYAFLGALVAFTGVASAQTTAVDPTAETTGFLADGVGAIAPIMIAVATGALVLLALNVGLKMAWNAAKARGARGA